MTCIYCEFAVSEQRPHLVWAAGRKWHARNLETARLKQEEIDRVRRAEQARDQEGRQAPRRRA
jgi:hypothetical protein